MHLRRGTQGERGYNGAQTSLTITVELNKQKGVTVYVRHAEDVLQ